MSSTIRPIAIGIFRRHDEILVGFAHDVFKGERYCRPPGGAIEFGERAAATLRREMLEEVHAEIAEPSLIGVLENTFLLEGVPKHELIFVFEAAFENAQLYDEAAIPLYEAGWEGSLKWVPLSQFRDGSLPLYPDGLLALLDSAAPTM